MADNPSLFHPTTREEWLKLRAGYVSSTESAALFGYSPYLTAYELALEKSQKLVSDFTGTERTVWGTRLQDAIAAGIGEDYGVLVRPQRAYAVHPSCRMGSSFDWEIYGLVENIPNTDGIPDWVKKPWGGVDYILRDLFTKHGPGILEIKSVDWLVYKNEWGDDPPAHIDLQVQHQLEVIRYTWSVIGVLVGGNRNEILIRERDPAVGASIAKRITNFWANLAKGILPPVTMPEDAAVLIRLYKFAEPGKLYDGAEDVELGELCRAYREAADLEKVAGEAKEVAKAKMLQRIGDADKAILPGFSISAGMVGECEIAYTRASYRNFRVYVTKAKGAK
jgi:predicted phage-related endonuclease